MTQFQILGIDNEGVTYIRQWEDNTADSSENASNKSVKQSSYYNCKPERKEGAMIIGFNKKEKIFKLLVQ